MFFCRVDTRGFNGSVNISERCEYRSKFDPLYIIFLGFFLIFFYRHIYVLNEKVKINESVSGCWIIDQNTFYFKKRNRMLLTLVSPGWIACLQNIVFYPSKCFHIFQKSFNWNFYITFPITYSNLHINNLIWKHLQDSELRIF